MGKPLSDCTDEELLGKAKMLKALLSVIGIMLAMMVGAVIYILLRGSEFSPAIIAAFVAILGGAIPSMSGMSAVKKEIASRSSSD